MIDGKKKIKHITQARDNERVDRSEISEKALKENEHRRFRRRFDDPGDSLSEFDSRCSDAEYKR